MRTVTRSMNEMPHIYDHDYNNDIDSQNKSSAIKILIDSEITDIPTENQKATSENIIQQYNNESIQEHRLRKLNKQFNFEGNNWTYENEKWKPPQPAQLNKMNTSTTSPTLAQSDSGANRIVTDNIELLENVKIITPVPMGGCNKENETAIVCTAIGQLPIQCNNGTYITVEAYYSEEVDGTIISPTTIVQQHIDKYSGWMQYSNCSNQTGEIQLIAKHGFDNISFDTVSHNDLWFHKESTLGRTNQMQQPKINRISNAAKYELWHQRLCHPGISTMESIHKHVIGIPKLKGNSFYRCPSCMSGKLCNKRSIGKSPITKTIGSTKPPSQATVETTKNEEDTIYIPNALPGQHFHMDFGFVRGSDFNYKNDEGKTLTSKDGKKAYLAIIDRSTRYTWIFLTDSKVPPIDAARSVLKKFKSKNPHRTVRVDQGGELGKSGEFKAMISEEEYSLELTGSDASAQNGMVENPNKIFGQMMRCMLFSADLGSEYWSWALLHAIYIKNRLPHYSTGMTPYEKFTGTKPDMTNLRIFGSKVYARNPGKRPFKLDHHVSQGFFLGYTATDKNIIYIDKRTGTIKVTTHVIYDEAHMSVPASQAPLAAQTLQRLGYYAKEDWKEIEPGIWNVNEIPEEASKLLIQQLTPTSTIPTRSTPESIGLDLYADTDTDLVLLPGSVTPISTGIAIQCPVGTYSRIAPRSGLTTKKNLTTLAGVIDRDYRGDVIILIQNFGTTEQYIKHGERIAQLIIEQAIITDPITTTTLSETIRNEQGFGSTEQRNHNHLPTKEIIVSKLPTPNTTITPTPQVPLFTTHQQRSTAAAAKLYSDIQTTFEAPYTINLSNNPYDNLTHRIINIRPHSQHPTLGMEIEKCTHRDLPILKHCKNGTEAARLIRWRSELRNGYITAVNDIPVTTITEIKAQIKKARAMNETSIKIGFSTINKQSMHPQKGIPQLYHDQLNIIGQHLYDIKNDPEWQTEINEELVHDINPKIISKIDKLHIKPLKKNKLWHYLKNTQMSHKINAITKRKKLTRRFLKQQPDWDDWKKSEAKQLNQYEAQETFGKPCSLPENANCLPLLWTYLIKDCGTKKARCVCNGSPKMRGSVTLADTYAGSLDQTGAKIFWSATALFNFITIGADASNAFAEAPPPKAPLYVTIDEPFREWYAEKYPDRPPLKKNDVLPVQGALQGHPESARLWAKLIDKVIKQLNLQPCAHEPCLYSTKNFNNTGKTVLFLRQVDDFAIACEDEKLAKEIISKINSKMTIDVKMLGTIDRFNGVDVTQGRHYVKLSNKTYIKKILTRHKWLFDDNKKNHSYPIPMRADNEYQRELENSEELDQAKIKRMEEEMGFGYRQAIGELIYALVTCRPDISYAVIKLSQYSTRPARVHFEALKTIYRYINATMDEGIYYWRKTPRYDLPELPLPECKSDSNYDESEIEERQQQQHDIMYAAVDSDYAGDTKHRKSVTGIVIRIAGGTILYKTRFQDTVALSSTEAEFTAAAEAGKYILYVRSILNEIGIPQDEATILYEDNQGALLMANAQQPTKRTRHMDIKTFILQQWVEEDLIRLKRIATSDNYSDILTKATGRTLFYRHMNFIFGKIRPTYVSLT
jgi:deoxyuridine 5'-triphosphate nucleotidohydrolase